MWSDDNEFNMEHKEIPLRNKPLIGVKKWISGNLLLFLTVLSVIFGVIIGSTLRTSNLSDKSIMLLSYPAEIFIRLLKLFILPLIISSLVSGSASLNASVNGKVVLRTLLYFLITSAINAVLGIILAMIIRPGNVTVKVSLGKEKEKRSGSVLDSLLDLGRNVVADNIFQATFQQTYTEYMNTTINVYNRHNNTFELSNITVPMMKYRAGSNTLGIVFFCLTFGMILSTLGERSKIVVDFFSVVFEVVMKMVNGIIWLTPLGICSVIAGKILSVSNVTVIISQLGWFIVTIIVGVTFYQLIILQLVYFYFVKKNPYKYYIGLIEGVLTAFATASTAAALPVTFTLMDEKLKIDRRISRFVLPIGCNINMDGTAMYIAMASIFIAQMNNIDLNMGKLVTICFASTAASFSSASVPSFALVLLLTVLSAIDTPVEDVSLLFAVDWLVDRFRTTNNMLGDCYAAAVVEKLSRKELMAHDEMPLQDTAIFETQRRSNKGTGDSTEAIEIIIQ